MTRPELILRDLVRALCKQELVAEDLALPPSDSCGLCGSQHVKLCPWHAALAYVEGLPRD